MTVEELPGSVLFACSMNAVRSPMAEAIMKHLFRGKVYVQSAGVRAGDLDGFAVSVMDEIGISISNHTPKTFEDIYDSSFDLIISLSPEAHHKSMEMTRTMAVDVEYWPTMDPTIATGSRDQIKNMYAAVRDQLLQRIKKKFNVSNSPIV